MALKKCLIFIGCPHWASTIAKIVESNSGIILGYPTEVKILDSDELNRNVNNLSRTLVLDSGYNNILVKADILVFSTSYKLLDNICDQIKPLIKMDSYGLCLTKGLGVLSNDRIDLISDVIRNRLNIPCASLMGANVALDVSQESYCEATIGSQNKQHGRDLKSLFQTENFRIVVIKDEIGCELCGALIDVVAVGAGLVAGLNYGENTKSAIIRLGFMEIIKFANMFFKDRGIEPSTFLESCCIADLIKSCHHGLNLNVGRALAVTGKSIYELNKESLCLENVQGHLSARKINRMLCIHNLEDAYPLFTAIHNICEGKLPPSEFINCLRNHPEHM